MVHLYSAIIRILKNDWVLGIATAASKVVCIDILATVFSPQKIKDYETNLCHSSSFVNIFI